MLAKGSKMYKSVNETWSWLNLDCGFSIYFVKLQGLILTLDRGCRLFTFKDLPFKNLKFNFTKMESSYYLAEYYSCSLLRVILHSSEGFRYINDERALRQKGNVFSHCLTTALKIKVFCKA